MRVNDADLEMGDDLRQYLNGVPCTGEVVEYGPGGVVLSVVDMVDGRAHGLERIWFETGELQSEVPMERGNPVGIGRVWHRNGVLAEELRYDRRGSAQIRRWDEDGVEVPRG